MKTTHRVVLAALTLAVVTGCAIDTAPATRDLEDYDTRYDGPSGRPELSVDGEGNLIFHDHELDLPQGREDRRFGATFVDVTPLPRSWRPVTAPDGGVVVAAIRSDSPLALVGIRPFERVISVDGVAVASVGSLVHMLESAKDDAKLRVTCWSHVKGDVAATYLVPVGEGLDAGHQVWLPFVFESYSRGGHSELTVGPADVLFYTFEKRSLHKHETVIHREWGALFNLIVYRSTSHVREDGTVGDTKHKIRLFYGITI
jgi:hypothetical protein